VTGDLESQAAQLRALQPGWDSYGAPKIDERAIQKALNVCRQAPQLTPCSDGGVQIDWSGAEITFGPDGAQEF